MNTKAPVLNAKPFICIALLAACAVGSSGNGDPREFRGLPDPYSSPNDLGPFVGNSIGDKYVYYFFMGIDENNPGRTASLPFDLLYGTIELPSITINGQRYERQVRPYKQTRFFRDRPSQLLDGLPLRLPITSS